jgi:hypothetical protein
MPTAYRPWACGGTGRSGAEVGQVLADGNLPGVTRLLAETRAQVLPTGAWKAGDRKRQALLCPAIRSDWYTGDVHGHAVRHGQARIRRFRVGTRGVRGPAGGRNAVRASGLSQL